MASFCTLGMISCACWNTQTFCEYRLVIHNISNRGQRNTAVTYKATVQTGFGIGKAPLFMKCSKKKVTKDTSTILFTYLFNKVCNTSLILVKHEFLCSRKHANDPLTRGALDQSHPVALYIMYQCSAEPCCSGSTSTHHNMYTIHVYVHVFLHCIT